VQFVERAGAGAGLASIRSPCRADTNVDLIEREYSDDVADDDADETLGLEAPCNGTPVNRMSEFAQASYFAGIMRTELVEARKAAKEAQRRWSNRRVNDNTEIPEHVVRPKRRVREANRVIKALEKRFPGI
jgi:hypothetical protein